MQPCNRIYYSKIYATLRHLGIFVRKGKLLKTVGKNISTVFVRSEAVNTSTANLIFMDPCIVV